MATLVDSNAGTGGVCYVGYNTTDGSAIASEWVATESFSLEQVIVSLQRNGSPSGYIWMEVWDDDSGEPGSLIANGTSGNVVIDGLQEGTPEERIFTFATPPSITNTDKYYFVVRYSWTVDGSNWVEWECALSSASGWSMWMMYANATSTEVEDDTYPPWIEIYKSDAPTPIDLTVADLDHTFSLAGAGGGWEVGAYIYPVGSIVLTVIRQLVVADLDHALVLDACNVTIEAINLTIANLDHALALEEPIVVLATPLGEGLIHLTIDATGKPRIYEGAIPRISGSNADVTDGDDVGAILDDTDVSLFVEGTQISATYSSLSVTTGTQFTMASIGTDGATDSVELFPRDVEPLLPAPLV